MVSAAPNPSNFSSPLYADVHNIDDSSYSFRYFEDRFVTAGKVFASPLTRALQTALLSLEGHPATIKKGVTCLRSAREIKSVGGQFFL